MGILTDDHPFHQYLVNSIRSSNCHYWVAKVTVSIVETHGPPQAGPGPERTPKSRMFAKLQRKAKLGNSRPSDEVEGLRFEVKWQPEKGALGVIPSPDQLVLPEELLQVVSS